MVIHDGGAENFALELFPDEIQKKLGYNRKNTEKGNLKEKTKLVSSHSNYISEESYGKKPTAPKVNKDNPFAPLPFESWVDGKFIFIPLSKYDADKGYMVLPKSKVGIDYIPYDRYKGKIFTVLKVDEVGEGILSDYQISIKMDETGERLVLTTLLGNVKGIALKRDIDYAREQYLGRTLWLRNREASSYNAEKDKREFFKVQNLQPVTIENILLSDSESWPLRFICKNSKGDTFIKVAKLSGTNSGRTSLDSYKFHEVFFTEDPRETFDWSKKEFEAIQEGKIFRGMTKEQVLISWGSPLKINRTVTSNGNSEQWVYGGRQYLYFEGDKLTTSQN
jgi:hypothetical protein